MARLNAKKRSAGTLQWVAVLLLLAALVGILLAEVLRSAARVSYEKALLSDYVITEQYDGYLFRDEERLFLPTGNNGPIDYGALKNGDTVILMSPVAGG